MHVPSCCLQAICCTTSHLVPPYVPVMLLLAPPTFTPAAACRYLPVLQLVTLLTTPATALYAIGGLLASPLVVPAIIIKNLVALVGRNLVSVYQPVDCQA